MLVVVEGGDAEHERGVVSDLFWFAAENRRAVLDASPPRDKTGAMECGLGERGLADAAVTEKYRTVDA